MIYRVPPMDEEQIEKTIEVLSELGLVEVVEDIPTDLEGNPLPSILDLPLPDDEETLTEGEDMVRSIEAGMADEAPANDQVGHSRRRRPRSRRLSLGLALPARRGLLIGSSCLGAPEEHLRTLASVGRSLDRPPRL